MDEPDLKRRIRPEVTDSGQLRLEKEEHVNWKWHHVNTMMVGSEDELVDLRDSINEFLENE